MPNIGPGELILILAVILVVFGPGKLPEIGGAVGRSFREFRRAASDVGEAQSARPAPRTRRRAAASRTSAARKPKRKA